MNDELMEDSNAPVTSIIFQCSRCNICYAKQDDLEKHIGDNHFPEPTDVIALLLVHRLPREQNVDFISQPEQDADQNCNLMPSSPDRDEEPPETYPHTSDQENDDSRLGRVTKRKRRE